MSPLPYRSAEAFRTALSARFKQRVRESGLSTQQLARQFAYDRFLSRVFTAPGADQWVLKGGGALLARLTGARHSIDLDLYRAADDLTTAEHALRMATAYDLDDFFTFWLSEGRPLTNMHRGTTFAVQSRIGQRPFERFSVDLVADATMTGTPEPAAPIVDLGIEGLDTPNYQLYPLVDHIADKLAAMYETHPGLGGTIVPSSRVKDFVDLAVIATSQTVTGANLHRAIISEFAQRQLGLPATFNVPDPSIWATGYERMARDTPALRNHRAYHEGYRLVTAFLSPILAHQISGEWQPLRQEWIPPLVQARTAV